MSEDSTRKAALKKFKHVRFDTDQAARDLELAKLKREAGIINRVSHNNIIHLFGVCYDAHFFGLILELCEGGSLGNVCRSIKKKSTLSIRVLANWAHQISSAMEYLTDRSILHRDLKADNVLVEQFVCFCGESETTSLEWCNICEKRPLNKLRLKVTDFGLSKTEKSVGHSVVGSLLWLAPEVLQQKPGQSNWSEFSDVWSFGVVLWELLARKMPHVGEYPIVVANWNRNGQTLKFEESWPEKWKDIMSQCWSLEPIKRPTFGSLVEYFKDYTDGLIEVPMIKLEQRRRKKKKKGKMRRSAKFPSSVSIWHRPMLLFTAALVTVFLLVNVVTSTLFYIEKLDRKAHSTTTKATTSPSPEPCSDGYSFIRETGYCYKAILTVVKFEVADSYCQSENAHLVSIHSEQKNSLVMALFYRTVATCIKTKNYKVQLGFVWIGLTADPVTKVWSWTDGTPTDYSYWFEGEPNYMDSEHRVQIVDFRKSELYNDRRAWYNFNKFTRRGAFVCKKSKAY